MKGVNEENVKQCCAAFYSSDLARLLLGDSFHPGGTSLTDRLAQLTQLNDRCRVLDVAAGRGASSFHLAESFGCEVVGIDLSEDNVRQATEEALVRRVADRVRFRAADAERLPFEAGSFDAVFCECAFCTFPNKQDAAGEFRRVLRPQGRLGLSDVTKAAGPLPELEGLLSWVSCIGDAQSVESYVEILRRASFTIIRIEDRSDALRELVQQIQGRLLAVEIAAALKQLDFPDVNFSNAKRFIQAASHALRDRKLGYTLIAAVNQ
jgi:arsenite methyltransferase